MQEGGERHVLQKKNKQKDYFLSYKKILIKVKRKKAEKLKKDKLED